MKKANFRHKPLGEGRPQIILLGNGPERLGGQLEWDALLAEINTNGHINLSEKEKWGSVPFPLLYELLSMREKPVARLEKKDINAQEARLKEAMGKMKHETNRILDIVPTLDADHIFTTNYTYCIEKAFMSRKTSFSSSAMSDFRFNLNQEKNEKGRQKREQFYRLRTGYLSKSKSGRSTGIWHIHGECVNTRGIIIGHDRYGRLLSRIVDICGKINYDDENPERNFTSWPELFLFGDVYVLGFAFNLCELDLWWLLKRKQRERFADGRVFFYEMQNNDGIKRLLLKSHGAEIIDFGMNEADGQFEEFYKTAFEDIREKIKMARGKGEAL